MRSLSVVLLITLGIYCAAAVFMPRGLLAAGTSGDLSGVWSTTDSCFPDAPYTMLLDQQGNSISLTSTVSENPSCSGMVSGSSIDLTCTHSLSSEETFALTGTVDDNDTISLAYAGSSIPCQLTKHDGMDPMVQSMLKFTNMSEAIKPLGERTPAQMRRYMRRMNSFTFLIPPTPVAKVRNISVPGPGGQIPLRIYTPEGDGPFPVIVFYHGGGWVLGTLPMVDHYCRVLTKESAAIVVSVGYRLAPEHVFPAALDDAYAALEWVAHNAASRNADAARIAVAGESAGGNLAAVVCMLARDRQGPAIRYQVLMSPVTNISGMKTQSYSDYAKGYLLTRQWMEAFRGYYLPDSANWTSPLVSPLLADDLTNLPPALVITAEYDVLRDEGEAYARRLNSAGVAAKNFRCGGVIHGFTTTMVDYLSQTKDAIRLTARELAKVF